MASQLSSDSKRGGGTSNPAAHDLLKNYHLSPISVNLFQALNLLIHSPRRTGSRRKHGRGSKPRNT
jgi:hypothetical protein